MPATVHLTLTLEQAYAVRDALDLFTRLGIGQLEEVAHLIRLGVIPRCQPPAAPRVTADGESCQRIDDLLHAVKDELGYSRNGSNGIGHAHVSLAAHRSYEVKKALARALALHRDPNPDFRGVDYDGLLVRYTQDLPPLARIEPEST